MFLHLNHVKEKYIHFNYFISEHFRSNPICTNKIFESTLPSESELQYLRDHKKIIKNNWNIVTCDNPIHYYAFDLIFKKECSRSLSQDEIIAEILRLLSADSLDTYRLIKYLHRLECPPLQKFDLFLDYLSECKARDSIPTDDKLAGICSLLQIILGHPLHRFPIISHIRDNFEDYSRKLPFKTTLFIFDLLEPSEKIRDLFSGERYAVDVFRHHICKAIQTEAWEYLRLLLSLALNMPGFSFGFSGLNLTIATKLCQRKCNGVFKSILKVMRDTQDLFAEYNLLDFSNRVRVVKASELMEEEAAQDPNLITPARNISLSSYLLSHINDVNKLRDAIPSMPILLKRRAFTYSLMHHNAPNLELLWSSIGLDQMAIIRLLMLCKEKKYYQSALFLCRALTNDIELKLEVLHKIAIDIGGDGECPNEKNVAADLSGKIRDEISQIIESEHSEFLFQNIASYPRLTAYILMYPDLHNKVGEMPYRYIELAGTVGVSDIFTGILFFESLLSKLPQENDEEFVEARENAEASLTDFLKRRVSQTSPSVLFEIIHDSLSNDDQKIKALQWVLSALSEEDREELINRLDSSKQTVLNYIDPLNFVFHEEWVETYTAMLYLLNGSKERFVICAGKELLWSSLQLDPSLAGFLTSDQKKTVLEDCIAIRDSSFFREIMEEVSLSNDEINHFLLLCLCIKEKNAFLKYVLRKVIKAENFEFCSSLFSLLTSASLAIKIRFLHYAFIADDFHTQRHILHLCEGENELFQELTAYFEKRAIKSTEGRLTEQRGRVFSIPEVFAFIALHVGILKSDQTTIFNALNSLNFGPKAILNLLNHLRYLPYSHLVTLNVIQFLPPAQQTQVELGILDGWWKSGTSNHQILHQERFYNILSGSEAHHFFQEPDKYPALFEAFVDLPDLHIILNRIHVNCFPLIKIGLKNGMVAFLKKIFEVLEFENLKDVLLQLRGTQSTVHCFTTTILFNVEKTLILLLEVFKKAKLFDDTLGEKLFGENALREYREFSARVFSFLSKSMQERMFQVYKGPHGPSILFEVVRNNNNELAEVTLPLIVSESGKELVSRQDDHHCTIFSYISRRNRGIFKKILPLVPSEHLVELTRNLEIKRYCYLASLGTEYAKLAPEAEMRVILELCIEKNHSEALLNFFQVWNKSYDLLETLTSQALNLSQGIDNRKILLVLLNAFSLQQHIRYEFHIIDQLLRWEMYKEVLGWMSHKLQSENVGAYFEIFKNRSEFCEMLFDKSCASALVYVRSLNLDENEQKEFLPFLEVASIIEVAEKMVQDDMEVVKIISWDGYDFELIPSLRYCIQHIIEPLEIAQLEEPSESNNVVILEKSKQLQCFISKISILDIASSAPALRVELIRFLSYLPISKCAVLIPLLERELFSHFLTQLPLNEQHRYLRFASIQQKEHFLSCVGLKHSFVDHWNKAKENINALMEDSSKLFHAKLNFKEHIRLITIEPQLDCVLVDLENVLQNSVETSSIIISGFQAFKECVKSALSEVRETYVKLNSFQGAAVVPPEYKDPITLEIMINPVVILDENNARIRVDSSTLSLLNNKSPIGGGSFSKHIAESDLELKATISEWIKENPVYE